MNKAKQLLEAISVNFKSGDRWETYFNLAAKKFGFGKFLDEFNTGSNENRGSYVLVLGPATNPAVQNQYLYLYYDAKESDRSKAGKITRWALGDKYPPEFEGKGAGVKLKGKDWNMIPETSVKIEDIFNQIAPPAPAPEAPAKPKTPRKSSGTKKPRKKADDLVKKS